MAGGVGQPNNAAIREERARVNLVWKQTFGREQTDRFTTVQKYIDSECIRLMVPYTPMLNGILMKNAVMGTVIGSGLIVYNSPYARYQYYGVVYGPNIPIFKKGKIVGFYSPSQKHSMNRLLKYNTTRHPKAQKMWFEAMKADKKEQILRGAAAIAKGKSK